MKEHVKETFNLLAHIYEHNVDTTSLYNIEYERPSMLKQLPEDLTNKKVLDAGCAAGWYTDQLIKRGANVVATDISQEMVAATKRRVGSFAEVVCLDLETTAMPFESNSFDIIVSSLTLHYVKEWTQTFREFQRILKPKGVLLFSVHHPFMDIKMSKNKDYFSTELIIDKWEKAGKEIEVPFYRRPIHSILNETMHHFTIEHVMEPQPTINFKLQAEENYEKLMKNPHFLIIRAINKDE
ncbi:class I SAM-dependent methyltransferase [Halalkalibacter kiskunsagensis]|uniref:Class I SAM-dependent methyltransferase n=1 Tax=Halalkalibacter kiskunsagensis TaxID=1548599 RepID=A0ABV6KEB9_9BACI